MKKTRRQLEKECEILRELLDERDRERRQILLTNQCLRGDVAQAQHVIRVMRNRHRDIDLLVEKKEYLEQRVSSLRKQMIEMANETERLWGIIERNGYEVEEVD